MTRVLVLMSVYNGMKYLPIQLNSIKEQSDVSVDILIRDDGSTDGTIDYLNSLNDCKIKCYNGSNKGATQSFFDLINNSSVDYDFYAFSDQDDYWETDKLARAVSALAKSKDSIPSLYYSGQKLVNNKLELISNHLLSTKRSSKANFIFNQMAGCTAVFNKKLLVELKKYIPPKITSHDGWVYKLCAALDGYIFVDREGKILYRQHGGNEVGLNNTFKGKIERSKLYIYKYKCVNYAQEILNVYSDELSNEWVEYLNLIIDSNKSIIKRIRLLFYKDILFGDIKLQFLFFVKVITGNL